jgi:hypothetical protein
MSETNVNPGKTPTHYAYHVRGREGKKGFWTKIGSAWPHSDGKGMNIQLDCLPVDGRIAIRLADEEAK